MSQQVDAPGTPSRQRPGVACFTTTTRAPRGPKPALEGAVSQQQGDGDNVDPVYVDGWTDELFTAEIEHLGSQWDFPSADTESLLQDICLTIPLPYGSTNGTARNSLAAFEDLNGFYTSNVSALMQAELAPGTTLFILGPAGDKDEATAEFTIHAVDSGCCRLGTLSGHRRVAIP
ncbi:hypothetical protein F4678DRAFT_468272 [Xylaria arbuscula]|nr:hypothetical protein F4678DRAFT_468272 [Xylaria arbuscula]